jgi:hypothetical protein
MSGHITALYHNLYDAGRAIEDLVASGVAPGEVSLITSEARSPIFQVEYEEAARGPRQACGAIGGALGAMGAHLASSPGGGTGILAAGPLLVSLAGVGTAGVGLAGSLLRAGIPEREAKFYEFEIRKHDALMVGVASLRHQPAVIRNILERHHPSAVTVKA